MYDEKEHEYRRLIHEDGEQEEEQVIRTIHDGQRGSRSMRYLSFASILLNTALISVVLMRLCNPAQPQQLPEKSQFAGLERNIPTPWIAFDTSNETEQDILWENTKFDLGNIALSDDYARGQGLPRAQRFPWDNDKGIYLINGYHNLHCVVTLRQSFIEYRTDVPQTTEWAHIKHCLMVLRDEVMCDASDTPRYTGFQPNRASGLGQQRMCRDWSKLEDWARENSGCWRHEGRISDPGFRELDRYRFCPPDSPYAEMAKTAWLPAPTAGYTNGYAEEDSLV